METIDEFRLFLGLLSGVGLIAVIFFAKAARISRAKFAIHFAITVVGLFGSILVMDFVLRPLGAFLLIADVLFLFFSMARRMNDIGYSRWWIILVNTFFGIIILPMLFFAPSKMEDENATSQPK